MAENTQNGQPVIPRFGLGEQLLGMYDMEVESVTKGRGSLIVTAGGQRYMLKEFTGSAEKLRALAQVLQELQAWDEKNETLIYTKEGEPFVREEGGPIYLLKTYSGGRECDVRNGSEVLEGVRKLAALHLALERIPVVNREAFYMGEHSLEQETERHNRELRNVKNYIRRKKQKNDFEALFLKNYEYFYQQADQAAQNLMQSVGRQQLCHGDYHYHNVCDCQTRSRILHYERMRWDDPMADLVKYVRKALEKNRWSIRLGMEMLRTYGNTAPFYGEDRRQVLLRLSYPEKFWKIANHYNNHKKAWAAGRDQEKLGQLLSVEQKRQEFLEALRQS
jgi:CotS family spore coat protein